MHSKIRDVGFYGVWGMATSNMAYCGVKYIRVIDPRVDDYYDYSLRSGDKAM